MMIEKWHDRVKRISKKRKITLDKIGRTLDIKKAAVSQKLSGKRATTVEELLILASMLDMSLDDLCCDDPHYTCEKSEVEFMNTFRSADSATQETLIKIMESLAPNTPK